ncbi:TolC family protein [Geotalea sp. SG265]|uniref:TolC family protein n=1 Tax=Geotalea sp. SG265 TaxID=2922867 RepID=UPI001FAF3958|nr:TolC family protein [Geotalea sp. SG265]
MGTSACARGALLLVLACFTFSATVGAAEPLSLSRIIDYSLRHNGELGAFREEKGIRDAALVRAGLFPNPSLEVEAASGALTESSAENSVSLGVSQEFLLADKRRKRQNVAERELEIYSLQLADRERTIREEVKMAFYAAILAKKRVELTEQVVLLNRQLLHVAGERLAAGDIPELELNLVKVELNRAEADKITAANALHQREASLAILMGLPPGAPVAIAGEFAGGPGVGTPAELLTRVYNNRPDLKALEAEKSRGDAEIALAGAEGIPNVTAALTFSRERTALDVGSEEVTDTDYLVGVRLSVPIPIFDRNGAGVREARARRNSAETRLSAAKRSIEREFSAAYAGYENSERILSIYKTEIIPQLEENLKLSQEAYRLGEIGILEVIQEQKKFFEVSDGHLTALHDRQTALVKLEAVTASELTGGEK